MAPIARVNSVSAAPTDPITVAPRRTASCVAIEPTPPAAPWISTVSPVVTPSSPIEREAASPTVGSAAATSQPTAAGLRARLVDRAYSA